MNRFSTALLVVAVSSTLVVGGCGGPGDDDAAAADESTVEVTAEKIPAGTADAAGTDVQAWATEFCGVVAPAYASLSGSGSDESTTDEPKATQESIVDTFSTFSETMADTAPAAAELGAPPVDGAEDFVSLYAANLTEASERYASVANDARAVDVAAPDALEQLEEIAGNGITSTDAESPELEASAPPELVAALTDSPGCESLN